MIFPLTEVTRLADRFFLLYISDTGQQEVRTISAADHDLIIRWRAVMQITPRVLRGDITVDQVVLPWQRAIVASQIGMNASGHVREHKRGEAVEMRERPTPKPKWRKLGTVAGVLTMDTSSQDFEKGNISVETDAIRVWTPAEPDGEELPRSQFTVVRNDAGKITITPQPSGFEVIDGELLWPL